MATDSSSSSFRERVRNSGKNGNLEFGLGGLIAGVWAVDQALQYRQEYLRQKELSRLQADADDYHSDPEEKRSWLEKPMIFHCIVRQLPGLDGNKCLTEVKIGDVVEVLEESIGPGAMYNLCRSRTEKGAIKSVGWFPTSCLEKMKE